MSAASAPVRSTSGPALPGARVTLRGRLLCPAAEHPVLVDVRDGLLHLEGDRIATVEPAPADCGVPETLPGAVWLPGFVDTHVHFPQTRIIGSATGPLLDWLASSVFPEEARFKERAYAEVVAAEFCESLLRQGTTCASIFSSSDPGATDVLFSALATVGFQADVGLTLMDRGAPPEVLLAAGPALEAAEALVARWHGRRLRFAITPRFALSCSPELLRGPATSPPAMTCPSRPTWPRTPPRSPRWPASSRAATTTSTSTPTMACAARAACSPTASTCATEPGTAWRAPTRPSATALTATSSSAAAACPSTRRAAAACVSAWARMWARAGRSRCGGWRPRPTTPPSSPARPRQEKSCSGWPPQGARGRWASATRWAASRLGSAPIWWRSLRPRPGRRRPLRRPHPPARRGPRPGDLGGRPAALVHFDRGNPWKSLMFSRRR
ncbi:MAG: amidohydrolase family protein [bacterium]